MTTDMAQKALDLARATGELLKRAQVEREKRQSEKKAVATKVPDAIKSLLENERIFEQQQGVVAEKLASSHVACLELIRDLAAHRNAEEIGRIGKPVGSEKTASASVITGAQTVDFDETESGQRFREMLFGARNS